MTRVGPSLCAQVLACLRGAKLPASRFAASLLTQPVQPDVLAAVLQAGEDQAEGDIAFARWPDALRRAALWAHVHPCPAEARKLLGAARYDWWLPPGFAAEQVAALLDAARKVGAIPSNLTEDSTPAMTAEQQASAATDNPVDIPESARARALREDLAGALTAAVQAAQQIDASVRMQGRVPSEDDLASLERLTQAFEEAVDWLGQQGVTLEEATVPAATRAIASLEESWKDFAERRRLSELHRLTGPEELHTPLERLKDLASGLLAAESWDATQRELLEGLLALSDLVDLANAPGGCATADPAILADCQQRAQALPSALSMLTIMAAAGKLLRTPPTIARARPDEGPVPRTGAETIPAVASDSHATDAVAFSIATPNENELPVSENPKAATDGDTAAREGNQPANHEIAVAQSGENEASETIFSPSAQPIINETRSRAETASVLTGIAGLIAQRRFGMAHAVAQAADYAEARTWALRVAALGQHVRPASGSCAAKLRSELNGREIHAEQLTLLLAVPALLRAALITGEPTTGALLASISGRLDPYLSRVATEVGEQALRGTFLEAPIVGVLADVTQLERRISAAGEAALHLLRPRKLRFQRATAIAKQWLGNDGLLGVLLAAAAEDDRSVEPTIREEAQRLSQFDEAEKEIDAIDRWYTREHSGKPVEGPSRQDLLALIHDVVEVVSEWLAAIAAYERHQTAGQSWAIEAIAALRSTVGKQRAGVIAGLTDQSRSSDPLVAAAANAARESMSEIFELLDGGVRLSPGEIPAGLALTAELLKVPRADVDSRTLFVTVPAGTSPEELLAAAAADWTKALSTQIGVENYSAVRETINLAKSGRLPLPEEDLGPLTKSGIEDKLNAAVEFSRAELMDISARLIAELRRGRARNELSDEQESELAEILRTADPARRLDLVRVRNILAGVSDDLSRHRREAAKRLSEQLALLVERLELTEDDQDRIRRLIEEGELAAAEEHLYFLEMGDTTPVGVSRRDLERFFPAVPEALQGGLTESFLVTVRDGGCHTGLASLDYSALSTDARGSAADALELWAKLGRTRAEERANFNHRDVLQAMRIIGIEAQRVDRRDDLPRGKSRRFIELVGISVTGKAMVPAFGSKLGIRNQRGGRLRILLVWDRPTAGMLTGWVDQDTSGDSILIGYFGTMPPDTRRELAQLAVSTGAPIVAIDDALLAYVAANGLGRLETTMATALPFSAVNPYVRRKRMLVAPEMFYGRDKECRDILDPDGTQVIFGGRGLGKSALLRESKDRFEREPERVAVNLELNVASDGGGLGASMVWDRLRQTLITAEVLAQPTSRKSRRDPYDAVREGALEWLGRDSRRKLLILLDEADTFFDSDSSGSADFRETKRLKQLVLESDGRAKVVFAGLHSVQRFSKLSGNSPFSHLGKATAIGPLRPQHAFDLINQPLDVLGFKFDDPELVHRILNYCSYQPYLLQMFGHRLIETMHARRAKDEAGPPYVVTETDVRAVESDAELRRDITSAFRDTLNLDPRYNVIANVLAHHAYENDLNARLSDAQLAEECRSWWEAGFATLDAEAFRSYLSELAGLGVLRPNPDGVGWRLRSSNALNMIGTRNEVQAELLQAESKSVPPEVIAQQTRRTLATGTRWPLTIAQVNDLLGDHTNQVRLVLGSSATGIDAVADTITEVVQELGDRFTLIPAGGRKEFNEALVGGHPGGRRLVLSDLAGFRTKPESCWESLRSAIEMRPVRGGVTRSVVLVADTGALSFWARVFTEDLPELGVVTLRRYDRTALRVWALEAERFGTEKKQEHLLQITSGWPYLIERALSLTVNTGNEDEALRRIADEVSAVKGCVGLIDRIGLNIDDTIAAAYGEICGWMDNNGMSWADLVDAAAFSGADSPESIVSCLSALGVLDQDENGRYRLEPLVARAWPHRRPPGDFD
ncbi:hypothetical protein [Nonomuraea sp. NPDC049480]|uniref:hypothetical protein n=1 Tax=Nonomuraea sp. NPDC049480 TaxID=3364353 RepID=UPI0037A6B0DB